MKLKDLNKKALCKMRTAIKATLEMHEMALHTGKSYDSIEHERAMKLGLYDKGIEPTPFCSYVDDLLGTENVSLDDCKVCPVLIISGKMCNRNDDKNPKKTTKRLRSWLMIINAEIDSRSKK